MEDTARGDFLAFLACTQMNDHQRCRKIHRHTKVEQKGASRLKDIQALRVCTF
jgi:hypothetical protein